MHQIVPLRIPPPPSRGIPSASWAFIRHRDTHMLECFDDSERLETGSVRLQGGGLLQQQQQVQTMNPVQAAMLQMGGLIGAQPSAGPSAGGGMAPGFAQFGIVPLAQLQGGGGPGGVQAMPLAGLTLLAPQVRGLLRHSLSQIRRCVVMRRTSNSACSRAATFHTICCCLMLRAASLHVLKWH